MKNVLYLGLLIVITGFNGLDGMKTTDGYGYTGWTDDGLTEWTDGYKGWVSCGCHEAPNCEQCGTKPYMCNGDCTWKRSYGWSGCVFKNGSKPVTKPPPTGETPVSMGTHRPPTGETPVSMGTQASSVTASQTIGGTGETTTGIGASAEATTAEVATTASAATTAVEDDSYVKKVKGYIDAGTCGAVTSTSNCGSSATSYFKSFTYKGKNVIISSQIPDHPAEHDQLFVNPNTRCERWQYIQLPTNPPKGSSFSATRLGTVGLAVTGGAFFNDLAGPQGNIAMANEVRSLDSCFGHSARGGSYHYHANINCTDAGAATGANDPAKCVLIGYYNDGVPVYGFCKDSSGKQFTSCYKINAGVATISVEHVGGTYTVAENQNNYSYDTAAFAAGSCNLDEGNGAVHPTTGQYSYFTTYGYPWVPIKYFGSQGTSSLCSAA